MVDNVITDPGSGGAVFATDDIGGVHYPITKFAFGALDSLTLVSSADGLPVELLAGSALIGKADMGAPDTGALDLAKVEDSVHSSGDVGVMALGVRSDVPASISGTDGDYNPLQTNDSGSLWTHHEPNDVDSGNSTTTPLLSSATFTGTGKDILEYSAVTVTFFADQDSVAEGMRVEFSTDNINWDISHRHDYISGSGRTFQFAAHTKYFRVVFINGATGQGVFRVQSVLHYNNVLTTIHRLDENESPDTSAQIVKATLIAQKTGTGDFIPIQSTAGGTLKVSIEESNGDITGGGTEATALRVTMASDSTGLLSVDDNGGSLTVDNGGTFAVQAAQAGTWNLNNISGAISLPTGAATAAKQLANGHNVAVASIAAGSNLIGKMSIDQVTANANEVVTKTGSLVALEAGTAEFGKLAAGVAEIGNVKNSGTFLVQAAINAGSNLIGKFSIDQVTANANEVVTKTGSLVQLEAGTAAIGKLTANDGVDIGDVDVASQPARVATVDNVGAAIQTNQMMDGITSLTPKYAAINVGSSGDNTLVAAVTAKKIRILQVILVAAGDVNVRFESGAAGTALTGIMALTTNSGFEASFCPVGHFETASNTLLNLELSAAVEVDGWLVYVEV